LYGWQQVLQFYTQDAKTLLIRAVRLSAWVALAACQPVQAARADKLPVPPNAGTKQPWQQVFQSP
jgi:hypothetical protein